ncbi:MAG: ABC transporter permease [Coriobacteriia bacterium]|nr:ABC transporter permease [Coriobacteriia bacterium]
MRALGRFLAKETVEIRRTWRLPTVGGVLLFFAVMSPLAALATPAIIASVSQSQPGVVIMVPDPTYLDSYLQWIKNLSQIGLLLVVFASAGLIAGERSSGTALLVVVKPVSRRSFAVAKFLAQAGLVAGATAVGTLVTWLGTLLAFGEAPAAALVAASGAWLVGALLAVAVTLALSAVLPTLAAGIVALVGFGLLGIAGLWPPLLQYTPVGILSAPSALLAREPVALAVPLATTALVIIVCVWAAGALFARREL